MYSLILKDFLMLKRMIMLIVAFVALFFTLENPPILAISLAGILFVSSAASFEDRSNSHIMLNSLPTSRIKIVSSKFIGALLFGLFAILLASVFQVVFHFAFNSYDQPFPEVKQIIISILFILIFTAIYYPILYKFGEKYTKILTMFLVASVIGLGQIVMYLLKDKIANIQAFLSKFSDNQQLAAGVIITMLLFLLSWFITIKIYKAKDF